MHDLGIGSGLVGEGSCRDGDEDGHKTAETEYGL